MRSPGDLTRHFNAKAEWKWRNTNRCFIVKLPALRGGLPGKVVSSYIVPLALLKGGACGARSGHRERQAEKHGPIG